MLASITVFNWYRILRNKYTVGSAVANCKQVKTFSTTFGRITNAETIEHSVNGRSFKFAFRCYATSSPKNKIQRQWNSIATCDLKNDPTRFTLMSYNILAQHYIDFQPALYTKHEPQSLAWSHRWPTLKAEIAAIAPDILCLQEVQQNHLMEIGNSLDQLGYAMPLFKKRSGPQFDGCAIFYMKNQFDLIECHFLDYFQPNIKILNRCNVAIIAKFALKANPEIQFVISTTHLLFNPKRHDIRLAQVQVLLAELDRIARIDTNQQQQHQQQEQQQQQQLLPIILSGDFNVQENSEPYRLITGQKVSTSKLFSKMNFRMDHTLSEKLLPIELGISDDCQHFDVVVHSQRYQTALHSGVQHLQNKDANKIVRKSIVSLEDVRKSGLPFNTGVIKHNLNLVPTFACDSNHKTGVQYASSYHHQWIMVDYIFYTANNQIDVMPFKLKLLQNYQLPTIDECISVGPIPNQALGSDHYAVAARFSIE